MCDIITLDISVGQSVKEDILTIIHHIRPYWNTTTLIIKELNGGEVNRLYTCGEAKDTREDDVMLIRVNGPGTEHYIDRERELLTRTIVHKAGMASPVYCRFRNGLAAKYHPGKVVTVQHLCEDFDRRMAEKLASLHHIDYKEILTTLGEGPKLATYSIVQNMSEDISLMLSQTPEPLNDKTKLDIIQSEFPSRQDVLAYVTRLEKELAEMKFPACLCHIDPNPTNIVIDSLSDEIHLIDWEFSRVDFAPHDIAVYFGGKCMLDNCSSECLKLYPSKEDQRTWIRWYLEYRAVLHGENPIDVTDGEVAYMYRGTSLYGQEGKIFSKYLKDYQGRSPPC